MNSILEILSKDGRCTPAEIATRLGLSESEAAAQIRQFEERHIILGYHALIDWARAGDPLIFAYIEVRANPERGLGFDRLAEHIAGFQEVHSVHLISGTHDLNVVIQGRDFREVALFVAEKLAPLPQVVSTATSFVLKSYKLEGKMLASDHEDRRLPVSP